MANSLVNALQAKRRFVESLTHHSKYGDGDDFLSPSKQPDQQQSTKESPAKAESPQLSNASQVLVPPHTTVKVKKRSKKNTGEIQLTESEYRRIVTLLESRQNRTERSKKPQRRESVPEWAKLAYASSNPNSRRNQYY